MTPNSCPAYTPFAFGTPMRLAILASDLSLPPSDPRHAETHGLLELFAQQKEDEVIALVPRGAAPSVPAGLRIHEIDHPGQRMAKLAFALRGSIRQAIALRAEVLLSLDGSVPWESPVPVVAEWIQPPAAAAGVLERLFAAVRRASLGGASALFVADDTPAPRLPSVRRVPPAVSAVFRPALSREPVSAAGGAGWDADYVLSWAGGRRALTRLIAGWTWVDGSLGDTVALVLLCSSASLRDEAMATARRMEVEASVRPIVLENTTDLPGWYREARAFLGTSEEQTSQVFRWALAAGVPVVAETSAETESITGDAAYLVPPADARSLGAAALTVLVEDKVADGLSRRGLERARAYAAHKALSARLDILRSVAARRI